MYSHYFLSFFIFISLLFGITGCSLKPGSYNSAIRFSENSSTAFNDQWNDQLLDDQSVGYETGSSHPYYILFYTEDLKDYDLSNMSAKINIRINGATTNIEAQNIALTELSNTTWRGTFYLPATLDDTPKDSIEFHLQDAEADYKKCSGVFFKNNCSTEHIKLSEHGYDATSYDTYSDPFAIKEVPLDTSDCTTKTKVLFLRHADTLDQTNCKLNTQISSQVTNFDLYINVDGLATDGLGGFTTEFNITNEGVTLVDNLSVELNQSSTPHWYKAENILTRSNPTEQAKIDTITNGAYKSIAFRLSGGANFATKTTENSVTEKRCCLPMKIPSSWKIDNSKDCNDRINNIQTTVNKGVGNVCEYEQIPISWGKTNFFGGKNCRTTKTFKDDTYNRVCDTKNGDPISWKYDPNKKCSLRYRNKILNETTDDRYSSNDVCSYTETNNPDTTSCSEFSETITSCPASVSSLTNSNDAAHRSALTQGVADMTCSKEYVGGYGSTKEYVCGVSTTSSNTGLFSWFSSSTATVPSGNWSIEDSRESVTTGSSSTVDGGTLANVTSDAFAIRPDHFTLYNSDGSALASDLIAGQEFNLSMKAENSANESVANYNTTLTHNNFSTTITDVAGRTCEAPTINTHNVIFTNGLAQVNKLSVNDIADKAMHLQMQVIDSSWTSVDTGDCIEGSASNTPNADGKVGCDIALGTPYSIHKVTPASFSFLPMFGLDENGAPLFILDSRDAPFTYLDDTLNQSLDINFTAKAISAKGAALRNYDAQCISQDVNLSVDYATTVQDDSLKLKYNYAFRKSDGSWNRSNQNYTTSNRVKIFMPKANFHKGSLSIGGHMNFTRDSKHAINPFIFYFTSAILNDVSNNIKVNYFELYADTLDKSKFMFPFLYGSSQVRVSDDADNINKKFINVDYDIYCNKECQQSNPQTFGSPRNVLSMVSNGIERNDNTLWWMSNPLHQVYETQNGVTKFKHGGVTSVNGIGATPSAWSVSDTKNNITTRFRHDNNTTLIESVYNGSKGYPFQNSINIKVSPWLQYNPYGMSDVSHRVDLRYTNKTKSTDINQIENGVNLKVKKENSKRIYW